MPSIQDFIEEFNRQILRQERKAASEMVRVYAEAWKRIKRRILALNAEYERMVADGIKPGPGWVYQSQRASELRAQISKELNTFSAFTEGKVTKLQKKAIEESLAYSEKLALMTLGPEPPGVRLGWVKVSGQAIINLVGANQASSPLYRLLRKIAVEGAEAAQDALVQGVILGHNPRKIAPMIRDALSIQLDRALKISRTEVLRAHREASQQSYKANDNIVKGWKWHSAADDRTCPSCWAMHGTEHPNSERFSSHPNCFPSGTLVSGPVPIAGTKRYYTGELVTIRTASGIELSFTPNHPILTPSGWVAGGFLKKGSYVVRSTFGQRAEFSVDIDYNNTPTPIEKVVEAFNMVLVEMPTSAEDFHGDGKGSKIHIVFTNSLLNNNGNASVEQPFLQKFFSCGLVRTVFLSTKRTFFKLLEGVLISANSIMSSFGVCKPFLGSHLAGFQKIGFGVTSDRNTAAGKSASDGCSGGFIGLCKRIFRFAVQISLNYLIRWKWVVNNMTGFGFLRNKSSAFVRGSKSNIFQRKLMFNASNRSSETMSQVLKTLSGKVEVDQIVEVNRSVFSGHVYNLQTKDEWYIANSIITHNCRCTPVPLTYSWAEIGARYGVDLSEVDDIGGADTSKTGEELFRNLSPVEQQQILGKSLWQAWSEGKVEFDRLSVRTYSADWGEGKRAVTLKELGLNARELLEAFRKTIEEK